MVGGNLEGVWKGMYDGYFMLGCVCVLNVGIKG